MVTSMRQRSAFPHLFMATVICFALGCSPETDTTSLKDPRTPSADLNVGDMDPAKPQTTASGDVKPKTKKKVTERPPTLEQLHAMLLRAKPLPANVPSETGDESIDRQPASKTSNYTTELEAKLNKYPEQSRELLIQLATDSDVGETAMARITDAQSQFLLAHRFEVGTDTERNFKKALSWYQKSAEQGFKGAQQKLKHFADLRTAVNRKFDAFRRHRLGAIDTSDALGQHLERAIVQMEFLRRTRERYSSRNSRSSYSGGLGLGSFGPAAQSRDAGNFAARMAVTRDMESLAEKIKKLETQYNEQVRSSITLTAEEKEFAISMGMR